jgi:hypothetical protein
VNKSLGVGKFTSLFDVWHADGTHLNNTPAADLPVQMALATPFRKPRNTSHDGGTHFWVVAIPVAACSDCLNSVKKRQ